MDVDKVWETRDPDCTIAILARAHRYKHIISSRTVLGVGVKNLRVLMVKRGASPWGHLHVSRVSDGAALHTHPDEFGSIPASAQFSVPAPFAIPPVRILRYFCVAGHNRADRSGGITL